MNKSELVLSIAEKAGVSKNIAQNVLNAIVTVVSDNLCSGNEVNIHGLGKFHVVETKPRQGRNPKTGEPVLIQAGLKPKFASSKTLKDKVERAATQTQK